MSGVYSYALTYRNAHPTGSGSGWSYEGPVEFYTPGGIVDVGATITISLFPIPFQLLEFPSPITHIDVHQGGLVYSLDAPAIPASPIYGTGFFGLPAWIGRQVTVDFPARLRGDDSITGWSR
jgi:hypothetical protein